MWISILYNELIKLCPESHHMINSSDPIVFPYLTYSLHMLPGEEGQTGCYVDIEVFDNQGPNQLPLEILTQNIANHFERGYFKDADHTIQSEIIDGGRAIPTLSTEVSRRLVQVKFKIDNRRY